MSELMSPPAGGDAGETRLPEVTPLRRKFDALRWEETGLRKEIDEKQRELAVLEEFLDILPGIANRLETLSQGLFGEILDEVERNLTYALREILGQDLRVVSTREIQRGKVNVHFGIDRNGRYEDIMTGQGGSVCNILSVGLRLIALSQLDEKEHRRFLVLDEQDCWLKPDLVSRLMSIVYTIARRLGFQILVISHHDLHHFREFADCIYRVKPPVRDGEGVTLEKVEGREESCSGKSLK